MFHEVLLALLGHSGEVIVCKGGRFVVAEDIPFAHEAERTLLNSIINVGYYYQQLEQFTDRRFNAVESDTAHSKPDGTGTQDAHYNTQLAHAHECIHLLHNA